MAHHYVEIDNTVYFGFVSNDTSGSAVDGTTPLFDVRLGGAAAGAAPTLSGTPTLLTHANYGPGAYEVAVAATTGNGFAAGNTYLVYVTVTADSQTPGSCVGSFTIDPVPSNVLEISNDSSAADNAESFFDGTGYAGTNNTIPTVTDVTNQVTANVTAVSGDSTAADNLEADYDGTGYTKTNSTIGTCTANTDMRGTDSAALASTLGTPAGADIAADIAANQTDITDIQGRLPAALVGGRMDSNIGAISEDSTAADNAESFFDGTGYAGTNNVIPTVTTLTNGVTLADSGSHGGSSAVITLRRVAIDNSTDASSAVSILNNNVAAPAVRVAAQAASGTASSIEGGSGGTSISAPQGITADITGTIDTVTDVTNQVSADMTAISGDSTAADNLEESATGIIFGTAQTGTLSTTQATTDLTGYLDDELIGRRLVFVSGTADGQTSIITDYASTNGTLTYATITTAPANNDTFVLV